MSCNGSGRQLTNGRGSSRWRTVSGQRSRGEEISDSAEGRRPSWPADVVQRDHPFLGLLLRGSGQCSGNSIKARLSTAPMELIGVGSPSHPRAGSFAHLCSSVAWGAFGSSGTRKRSPKFRHTWWALLHLLPRAGLPSGQPVYATQFHPELDLEWPENPGRGLQVLAGYNFEPDQAEAVIVREPASPLTSWKVRRALRLNSQARPVPGQELARAYASELSHHICSLQSFTAGLVPGTRAIVVRPEVGLQGGRRGRPPHVRPRAATLLCSAR